MGKYILKTQIKQLLDSDDEKTQQLGTILNNAIGNKDTLDITDEQDAIIQKYLNPVNTTDTKEVVNTQNPEEPVWAADARARTYKSNVIDRSKLPQNWEATSAKYRFGSEPHFDSKRRLSYLRTSDGKILYYPDIDAYAGLFPRYKDNSLSLKLYPSGNSEVVGLDTVPLSVTKPSTYALWKTNSDADEISTEVDEATRLAKNPELHGVDRTDNSNWLQGLAGFTTGAVGLGGGTYLGGKVLYPIARKLWSLGLENTPSMASYAIKNIGNKSIKTGLLGGLAGLGNMAKAAVTANPLSLTLSALMTSTETGKGSDFKIKGKDGSIHDRRYETLTPEGNWVSKQSSPSTPQSPFKDASKEEVQSYLDAFAKTNFSGSREKKNYSSNQEKPIADRGYYIIGENGHLSFETEEQANAALDKLKQDSRFNPLKTRLFRVNKNGGKMKYNYFKEGGKVAIKALNGVSVSPTNTTTTPIGTATTPAMSQYARNSILLGNTEQGFGGKRNPGGNNALSYAGANGHMGAWEMKRFNREQGLEMTKQERKAFRRALNGKTAKAGDNVIINNYYARLSNTVPGAEPIKPATKEETQALQRNALQGGWQAYNEANKATDGFSDKIEDVTNMEELTQFMIDAAKGADWANDLDLTIGEEGTLTPEQQDALQSAYLRSLNAGDYNIYAEKYNNLKEEGAPTIEKKNIYGTANDWLASNEARDLYQNAVNDEVLADYRAQAAKDAQLAQMKALGVKFNKKGGTMTNKYQQGGAAPAQGGQDMQAQITQLVQAAMSGDEQATQTINKIMEAAKAGDQQALQIAQMIQAVAKQMQEARAQVAKFGSKLNYIHQLTSGCPSGTEAVYFKKGGHICKTCVEKTKKAKCGTKCEQGAELDKCGGKAKKKYFGGSVESDKCGGKTKKAACGSKAPKAACGTKASMDKCGGKAKKKCLTGGILTLEALQAAYKSLNA